MNTRISNNLTLLIPFLNFTPMTLPRNCKSYNNKPWCYFFFKTQETLDAATEMKFTLRKRELQWCGPDDIKKLCPRCSSLTHSAKDCDAFKSNGRGRSNTLN